MGISAVGKRNDGLSYCRHLILLLCILPVCLRINIDLSKIYFTYLVKNDKDIVKAYVRNPQVIEELGRIDYLITDKTGTLTQKKMKLEKICTEFAIFDSKDKDGDIASLVQENCDKFPQGP